MLKINKRTLTNLISLGIFLFGIYPLIPHRFESLSVILFLLFSIFYLIIIGKKKGYLKTFFIVSSFFFLLFISSLLSSNIIEGFNKMGTMFSLLIFPIIFYLLLGESFIDTSIIRKVFIRLYYVSCLIFTTISFYLFSIYKNVIYPTADSNFYRNAILDNNYIGEHPIYISIFLSIAVIFGFSFFNKERKYTWSFFLILITQGYLITLLILLMSKGVLLGLIVVYSIKLFRQKINKKVQILSFLLILSLFFIFVPKTSNRFKEIINSDTYGLLDENNSTSIRVLIYKCGIETLFKNPFLGSGIGDVQELLDECYFQKKANFTKGMYNSHNQYLFIWLSSGILGILLFIGLLIYYFKKALQYNDNIMFSVLVLYCVVFLFENVLSRQSGVIFFSFLMNYFLWDNFNRNKIITKFRKINH